MFGSNPIRKELDKSKAEFEKTNQEIADYNRKARVEAQKAAAQKEADKATSQSSSGGGSDQQEVTCPTCSPQAKVKDKSAGKYIINLNFFFTKFTIRIPKIFDFIPKVKTYDETKRKGQKCEACDDKKKIKDVADDKAKYQQVAQQAQAAIPEIMEQEAKLGLGGTRTTIIQGNENLQVGAIFNNNKTFRPEKEGGIAIDSLAKGTQPRPHGAKCQKPVPVDGMIGWPAAVGNYTIKCGSVYNLLVGAGGVNIDTKGPINIKGGITSITAPQITLGCKEGPLRIDADSIDISGSYINVSPTKGKFYVRGAVHSSGNMVCAGHTHSESMSFVKAACCGTNETSTMDQGNKDVSQSRKSTWGGMGVKAIITSLLDVQLFYSSIPSDDVKVAASRILGPSEMVNTANRMLTMIAMMFPIELLPTGICITILGPGIVYNFPHLHGVPPMMHTHNTRVPDIDTTADSPEALRGKVLHDGTEGNAPGEAVRDSLWKKINALIESISSLLGLVKQTVGTAVEKIHTLVT